MFLPPISVAFLYNQPHIFHTLTVFRSGGDDINSCCVDAAVTEDVGELGNILFNPISELGCITITPSDLTNTPTI